MVSDENTIFEYADVDTQFSVEPSRNPDNKGEVWWFWMARGDHEPAYAVIMPRRQIERLHFILEVELDSTMQTDEPS